MFFVTLFSKRMASEMSSANNAFSSTYLYKTFCTVATSLL